jgi:ZIP family zinc transporter
MAQAIIFGVISGLALVLGALAGTIFSWRQKVIAGFMAFGSGVLICALTFGLMEEAFRHGGWDAVIIGFLLGGLVFIVGDWLLYRIGGRKHKRRQVIKGGGNDQNGAAITLGAVLDGVPESIALGIAIFNSSGTGLLMLVAIFLSNFPESISSVSGLAKSGFSKARIISLWSLVGLVTTIVTILSFIFLRDINLNIIGMLESFAAGAILAMLADSMMPEAYEDGGPAIAFLTILGFLVAFVISRF